jgi:hypothetical protein
LDGHRLSDFSEGALVSCAKGGWMDGWMDGTQEQPSFFYWRNVGKKRNLKFKKKKKIQRFFRVFIARSEKFFLGPNCQIPNRIRFHWCIAINIA